MSEYVFGDENASLRYLFDQEALNDLGKKSPIVLYGEKASGKTAIAITLAVCWARQTKARPLCFTTGSAFAKDFAAAVEIDDVSSFRSRFRSCKLMILDDLEPISLKSAAQLELAQTIDQLLADDAPILVTSGTLPAALDRIDARLSSRLSAGFSTRLFKPGPAAQRAILTQLVKDIDPELNTDELTRLTASLSQPLNALDLKTIVTIAHQNRGPQGQIDVVTVGRLVAQYLAGNSLTVGRIAKSVARKMRVKLSDMRGSTRQANIVRARGLAILLARKLTPSSLQQIGQFFGGRDHSTILHACRKTLTLVESDPELAKALSDVQAELLD